MTKKSLLKCYGYLQRNLSNNFFSYKNGRERRMTNNIIFEDIIKICPITFDSDTCFNYIQK